MDSSVSNHLRNYLMLLNSGPESEPVLLKGMISSWPASRWQLSSLDSFIGDIELTFRVGMRSYDDVLWESSCDYVRATVQQFNEWLAGNCQPANPLQQYNSKNHWLYADYKYMSELFGDRPAILKSVDWSSFGFNGQDGKQSTFWLGSEGASTVCHYDTYGCNLVAQICGRKRWVLFPPSQTEYLYPTRIPFEESSVFSQVNIKTPDFNRFPAYKNANPHVVTLEPGDVLFVPRHWWHFVESLEPSISINNWIEIEEDKRERVKEAIVRTIAVGLMSEDLSVDISSWLNSTEEPTDHQHNMEYLRTAFRQYAEAKTINLSPSGDETVDHDSHFPIAQISCIVCKQFVRRLERHLVAADARRNSDHVEMDCDKSSLGDRSLTTADLVQSILQPGIVDLILEQLEKSKFAQ